MTANVLAFIKPEPKPVASSFLVRDVAGGVFRIPLQRLTYVGMLPPKSANEWEITYLDHNKNPVTLVTPAVDAIMLLVKLAKLHGINMQSNIA